MQTTTIRILQFFSPEQEVPEYVKEALKGVVVVGAWKEPSGKSQEGFFNDEYFGARLDRSMLCMDAQIPEAAHWFRTMGGGNELLYEDPDYTLWFSKDRAEEVLPN